MTKINTSESITFRLCIMPLFFIIPFLILIAHCWPFFLFLQQSSWVILTSFASAWVLSVRIKRHPLTTRQSLSAILSLSRMQLFLEYGIVHVSLGFYQVGELIFRVTVYVWWKGMSTHATLVVNISRFAQWDIYCTRMYSHYSTTWSQVKHFLKDFLNRSCCLFCIWHYEYWIVRITWRWV